MVRKENRAVMLTVANLSQKFVEIYEHMPEMRGKSPSGVASVAFDEFWKKVKIENHSNSLTSNSQDLLYIFRSLDGDTRLIEPEFDGYRELLIIGKKKDEFLHIKRVG